MGIGEKIGKAAIALADTSIRASGGAIDTLADAVTGIPKEVTEGIGRMIEAVGNRAASGLDATASWLGGGLSAGLQAVAMTVRGIGYGFSDIVAGLIRIVGGTLALSLPLIVKGLGDIAAGVAGAVIAIAGSLAGFVQTLLRVQPAGRPLTKDEAASVDSVFRGALALGPIRIIQGDAGLFTRLQAGYPARPFTLGNRIYMQQVSDSNWIDVLVHECGHVWQNQHDGPRYIAEALWAQKTYEWVGRNAYLWDVEMTKGKARWQDFNREAQAEFIQSVWQEGRRAGPDPGGAGAFFDAEPLASGLHFKSPDLTAFAKESIAFVRRRR